MIALEGKIVDGAKWTVARRNNASARVHTQFPARVLPGVIAASALFWSVASVAVVRLLG